MPFPLTLRKLWWILRELVWGACAVVDTTLVALLFHLLGYPLSWLSIIITGALLYLALSFFMGWALPHPDDNN